MKYIQNLTIILLIALSIVSCDSTKNEVKYGKATKELIALVESNPELKSLLESSLENAKKANPNRNTNPAQTLEEYYEFITWTETTMPWAVVKRKNIQKYLITYFKGFVRFIS